MDRNHAVETNAATRIEMARREINFLESAADESAE